MHDRIFYVEFLYKRVTAGKYVNVLVTLLVQNWVPSEMKQVFNTNVENKHCTIHRYEESRNNEETYNCYLQSPLKISRVKTPKD